MLKRLAVLVSKDQVSGTILQDLARIASTSGRGFSSVASTAAVESKGESIRPALDVLREKLTQGPDFSDFLTGQELAEKYSVEAPGWKEKKRKPEWMKRSIPGGEKYAEIKAKLRELKLHTVCEEAKCPNIGECWGVGDGHTATVPLQRQGVNPTGVGALDGACTGFCAVKTSRAPPPLDPDEPENVSKAIAAWGLDYVVLTSVDRDDLPDGGAEHISTTIRLLKEKTEGRLLVEALVPDFQGDMAAVTVSHSSLCHGRDRQARACVLLGVGVDVVTLGQYMRPTKKHMAVSEFVTPEAFSTYQAIAESMGFLYVASGPMVRSSYRAGEFYLTHVLRGGKDGGAAPADSATATAATATSSASL
ncbi:MAG: hypothetical protein WDW38_007354 [Sanguina aurantia]